MNRLKIIDLLARFCYFLTAAVIFQDVDKYVFNNYHPIKEWSLYLGAFLSALIVGLIRPQPELTKDEK